MASGPEQSLRAYGDGPLRVTHRSYKVITAHLPAGLPDARRFAHGLSVLRLARASCPLLRLFDIDECHGILRQT